MLEPVWYHDNDRVSVVLRGEPGRKYIPIIRWDGREVYLQRVDLSEGRYMKPANTKTNSIRRYRRLSRSFGCTKPAKEVLYASKD